MAKITRTFKSGNSVAVRLPKSLGIPAGTAIRVHEERGRYVLEPVDEPERIDLTGIYGACPGLKPVERLSAKPRKLDLEGKKLRRG